jgi:hypothetical protein
MRLREFFDDSIACAGTLMYPAEGFELLKISISI